MGLDHPDTASTVVGPERFLNTFGGASAGGAGRRDRSIEPREQRRHAAGNGSASDRAWVGGTPTMGDTPEPAHGQ